MAEKQWTLRLVAEFLGCESGSDEQIANYIIERERLLRMTQRLLETHKSAAATAEDAIRDRIDEIQAGSHTAQADAAIEAIMETVRREGLQIVSPEKVTESPLRG